MGAGFLFSILIWIILILLILIWLIISLKKKRVFAIIVSSLLFLFFISFYFSNDIEELQFNKENVRKDLKSLNINLNDDFKIINNEISGMPERYQETKLLISTNERKRLIKEIINSENFKNLYNDDEIIIEYETNSRIGKEEILNYKYPDFYSKEILKRIDNYPTRILVYINENSDTLSYHKIEE